MDKLKYIKIENEDGSLSDNIPLGVDAENVDVTSADNSQNLADYISVNDGKINSINSRIGDLQDSNTSLSNQIKSLSSGSPKGSYATVSALKSANPETGVYVIQENGHLYSWIKNGNDAIDLGVYQATEIADNTINNFQTQFLKQGKNKLLFFNKIANGITVSMKENGYTSFVGTAASSPSQNICGQFFIDKIGVYNINFKVIKGNKPTFYIYDKNEKLIHTIPARTLNTSINFENIGMYTLKLYVQQQTSVDCELYGSLIHSSLKDVSVFFEDYFKASYLLNKTNNFNVEKNPIFKLLNLTIINTLKNYIGTIDTKNCTLQLQGQNYIVYNTLFNPYLETEDKLNITYKRLDILNPNINDLVQLVTNNSLNICYLDKECIIRSCNFEDFKSSIDNDIILFTYFCSGNKIVSINTFDNNFQILGLINENTNFNNLTLNAIGDSLTYGFINSSSRLTYPYPEEVKNQLNLSTVYNNGVSGSTIANINQFSISSDERLSNYEQANIFAIMGGTNDYYNNVTLGDLSSEDETTFYGGYKKILSNLINNNPSSLIFTIIPPCSRYLANRLNEKNYSWNDMSNAIKEISSYFGVPCIDMMKLGQLSYFNRNTWTSDGTHFNQKYVSNIFAPKVANFIYNNLFDRGWIIK